MARNFRVTLVLNQIEQRALDSYCAKHKIERSRLVRQILADFLYLPPDEQHKIRRQGYTLTPRSSRSLPGPIA